MPKDNRKIENKTVINNWNFGDMFRCLNIKWLMKWMLILIIVSSLLSLGSNKLLENSGVYNKCMDTCKKELDVSELSFNFNELPNQFYPQFIMDKSSCIDKCNDMYLKLRGK